MLKDFYKLCEKMQVRMKNIPSKIGVKIFENSFNLKKNNSKNFEESRYWFSARKNYQKFIKIRHERLY